MTQSWPFAAITGEHKWQSWTHANDRDWLHQNQVLLVVAEKMYIPEPVAGLPEPLALGDRETELPLGEQ